MFIFVGTAKG